MILRLAERLETRKLTFVTGLLLAVTVLFGMAVLGTSKISAAACSGNNIIDCGFSSPSDFINIVRANNNGVNGISDLQAIYAHYGLTAAEYDDFSAHAVAGEALRDGRIIVNGQVVGTGGMSIGRMESYQGSNPFTVSIDGHDYFGNVNSQAFAAGVNEIPIYALFSSSGTFQFAVMPACGNTEFPSVTVQTTAACQVLNQTPVEGQVNAYSFTAAAIQEGNASIVKYVYNFGDGSPTVTETNGNIPVNHTYTTSGTYTASVTIFASVPGNPDWQLPAVTMCTKQVVVTPPPAPVTQTVATTACQLVGVPQEDNKMTYIFTATAQSNSGLKLTSGDLEFGDANSESGVQPSAGGVTVTGSHTYSSAGTYTATATLHFASSSGWQSPSATCTAVVTVAAPLVAAAPTKALPNTGAGDVIGIFLGTFVAGTIGYRLVQHRKLSRPRDM